MGSSLFYGLHFRNLKGDIFVGFFAALFGGTPAQVSGPTGPMTVVTAALITQYAHEPAMAFRG